MAAPLTDLLKASGPGTRRIVWSVECDSAFNMLKTTLTSAQVLRHFNLDLCTAVHIAGSQNAVGAVLLQWQPGETEPRPVAFMSRKLSGAQYRYDARNVEALAAQMTLTTWRTTLLGVQFEIYSDHDSLKYLFTQKAPSQRSSNCASSYQIMISQKLSMCPAQRMWCQISCHAHGNHQR